MKATIDGANISIEYGRPYMKGRKIEGGLIPYDSIWRAGADEATTLTSDKALVIGGTKVPAGKHTLYVAATAGDWQLAINNQTGQWGTDYDQKQDLARVVLTEDGHLGTGRTVHDPHRTGRQRWRRDQVALERDRGVGSVQRRQVERSATRRVRSYFGSCGRSTSTSSFTAAADFLQRGLLRRR